MNPTKAYAMFSLMILVLSVHVQFQTFREPGGGMASDQAEEGPIVTMDQTLGPQYNGNTLHVGSGQTYSKIQSALDDSVDGDVIVVHPGKYIENVVVDTAVHIRGMRGAIIEGSNLIAVSIAHSNITISGMGINSSNNGIYCTALGLNVSDCIFYRNTIEVRIEVINNTLTRDLVGYPIEIINNTIDHASTSNMLDITITLGANWRPTNITVGPVLITKNNIKNNQNRGYHVRIRETVSTFKDATISLGEIKVINNNLSAMEYGISLLRTINDLENVRIDLGEVRIEDNLITNPRTQGIAYTNILSRWTGTTKGNMGDMTVRGNRIVSSSIGGGISISPILFTQCSGLSHMMVGDINVSSNYVNVSGRALYVNINQPMNTCTGNASITIGKLMVWKNELISRGNIGINYVLSTISLNYNTSASFGRILIWDNKVVSSFSQGITAALTDLPSSMSGNAVLTHGGFDLRNNSITSGSYSVYLNFQRVGKGATGSSRFSMGGILAQGNVLSGSNGIRVILSDSLTNGGGGSITVLEGMELRSNKVKSTSQSIYLSLTNIVSHISGNASASMGKVSMIENSLQSNTDGVYLILDTICYDHIGGPSSEFGGLVVEGNTMSTVNYGVNTVRMRYVGQNLYDNSSARSGEVSVSGNDLIKGTGINIGIFSYIGFYLYDNSTFDMGGFRVNTNNVNSSGTGISLGQCNYLGSNVNDNASSMIGDTSIDENVVRSGGIGINVASLSIIVCTLSGSSKSSFGLLSVEDNDVLSGDIGINVGSFGPVGTELYDSSGSEMEGLSISGNRIISQDTGINLASAYNLGSSLSGTSSSEVGKVRISDNTITSGSDGVYVEAYQEIGSNNGGRSNSSVGGLEISYNAIDSDGIGVFLGTPYIMGYLNTDDSRTEIGDISLSGNKIVSNDTGILVGFIGVISFHLRGNATVKVGRFGFDGNTISSNASGIHILREVELVYLSYDNTSTHLDGFTLDENIIDSKEMGIIVPEVRLGLQMVGRSKAIVRQLSSSRNRISSGGGLSMGVNVTEHQGNSSLTIGSLELDRNVIEGSEGNGIALDLSFWTLENSTFTMGPPSISDNRLVDVNWSAVRIVRKINISEDSTFVLGGLELVHNNMTRCSLGLNLTGCGYVDAYLNNFIGNEVDVLSDEGTSVTWYSPEKMWYRHKNANFTNYLGNFWDRYTGPDADDNGIGDVPYDTGFGLDLYPLTSNVDDHFPPWNDVTPPTVTIHFPTNGSYLRQTEFTLNYSVSDNLQGFIDISLIIDGRPVYGRADRDLSNPDTIRMYIIAGEGVHTIVVSAVDMAGNENSTSSTFMVDVTDPVLTLVSPQDGAFLGSNDVELVWEGSDVPSGLDRFEVRFDTWDWIDVGSDRNRTFSDLAEGEHLFQVRAWDMAGNQRTVSTKVVIDTIKPQLTVLNPVQDHYYNTSDLEVRWAVVDMTAIVSEMDLDGTGFVQLGSATEHHLTGLVQGQHRLTVRVTDRSSQQVEKVVSFTVDLIDPEVNVLSPGKYVRSSNVTVMMRANGTGSPLGSLSISLNGGQWTVIAPMVGPDDVLEFDLYGMTEGDNTIHIDLSDLAGNHWQGTIRFTLDITSPMVLTASPTGIGVRTDISVLVEFSEVLDPEGFDFDMGVEGELSWEGPNLTFDPYAKLSPDTIYSVRIEGTDPAGNPLLYSLSFTTASKGTIVGRIVDGEGEPVVDASIVLDTGETATTGQDGRFSIGSSQGNRTVTVTYKGKVIDSFNVDVIAGADHDVGDRSVDLPIEDKGNERSFPWLLLVLLAALVVLVLCLILFFIARRRRANDEEEEEWGMEEDEDWGLSPDELGEE